MYYKSLVQYSIKYSACAAVIIVRNNFFQVVAFQLLFDEIKLLLSNTLTAVHPVPFHLDVMSENCYISTETVATAFKTEHSLKTNQPVQCMRVIPGSNCRTCLHYLEAGCEHYLCIDTI